MRFAFDQNQAKKPIRVSWKLSAKTVAALEEMAREERATVEQVAQQALDHVIAEAGGKKRPEARAETKGPT